MALGAYVGGLICFALIVGGAAWAAWRCVRARLHWMAPEARLAAGGLLWLAAMAASTGIPLTLGILTRGTAIATALLLAGLASTVPRAADATAEAARGEPSDRGVRIAAGVSTAVALVYFVAYERGAVRIPVRDIDSTGFILPTLIQWVREGSMWNQPDFVAGWGFGAYPNSGGLVQLVALVSWHSDFALRAVNPTVMLVGAVAVYTLAAELGAPRAWGLIAAVLATMLPAAVVSGFANAQTDSLAATGIAGGALFLARHARTGRRSELALAVVGLGLAFGTKWYGPPEIVALLAVWVGARLIARQRWRPAVRDGVAVGLGTLGLGAVWLIRNSVEYANPLFPSRIRLLGIEAPPGNLAKNVDFSIAHYLDQPRILADIILPQYVDEFALSGGLALLGTLVAVVLLRRRPVPRACVVALAAIAVLLIYLPLPYTALGTEGNPAFARAAARYAVPGFMLAFAAAAWTIGRAGPITQRVVGVLALLGLMHGMRQYPDASIPGQFDLGARELVVAAVVIGLAGALGWLARTRFSLPPRPAALGAAALVVVLLAAGGRKVERSYEAARYRGIDPSFEYIVDNAPDGATIGLAGRSLRQESVSTVAFGPRFGNDVRFLGPRTRGMLLREPSAARFRRRLRRVDLLAIGLDEARPAPETAWARAAGWRVVATSPSYTLLARP